MNSAKQWRMAIPAMISASVMALAGCGGGGAASSNEIKESEGNVTLTMNYWGGDARIKRTEQVIEAFEKANPNITVELANSDWTGYWDKITTSVAGGNAPDVIQMDEMYLSSYGSNGSLLDLSKVDTWLKFDGLDKSTADMGKVNGIQYAIPQSTTGLALALNLDLLDKLGIEVPSNTDTWTWDDLEAFQKEIYTKSNGEIQGTIMCNNGYMLTLWARQHGEDLFKDGKVAISEQTLQALFDRTTSMIDTAFGGNKEVWSEQTGATMNETLFGTQKAAILLTQSTQVTPYANAAGTQNMTLVPIPSDSSSSKWEYAKPGMYWSISAKSEHPAEAAKLVDYLVNSEEAGKILGTERGIPANNKVRKMLAEEAAGTDKLALEFTDTIADSLGDAPEITPNGASDIQNVLTRYMQDVVFGKISSADAAKDMIAKVQTEIDNAA